MKLLNQSIKHTSLPILVIIGVWGVFFFYNMVEEIKENVDEGLGNYKRQIIYKAHQDTVMLSRVDFDEGFYAIRQIPRETALSYRDTYKDTIMLIRNADESAPGLDPVRMLSTAFEDDGRYYELKIINPMVEKDALVHRLLLNIIWLYALLIITIVIISNLVLQRLWKPFYELLRKLQTYRLGKSEELPQVRTKTNEFLDLQKAVGTLLNHNLLIYERQKQFIGNASHELQTPLAIAMNKLELLLENGHLREEQALPVTETMDIIERLIRLNRSLLLLTKIENGQFLNREAVMINPIVRQGLSDLAEITGFKNLNISVTEDAEIVCEMDPALADILINNLLRNAVFHNVQNGRVSIVIKEKFLSIGNTGADTALDTDKIYQRFYKSRSQRGSTGLGLAIIKAIADVYKISISYTYTNGEHRFELNF